MKGIVIKGGKDIFIHDNVFENLEVAIEAENVTGLWLKGNRVIFRDKRIDRLIKDIARSSLPPSEQKTLIKETVEVFILGQKRTLSSDRRREMLEKIGRTLGRGAAEVAKELLVEVLAGKILLKI